MSLSRPCLSLAHSLAPSPEFTQAHYVVCALSSLRARGESRCCSHKEEPEQQQQLMMMMTMLLLIADSTGTSTLALALILCPLNLTYQSFEAFHIFCLLRILRRFFALISLRHCSQYMPCAAPNATPNYTALHGTSVQLELLFGGGQPILGRNQGMTRTWSALLLAQWHASGSNRDVLAM